MSKLKYVGSALALCWLATSCTDDGATSAPAADMSSPSPAPVEAPVTPAPAQPPATISSWEGSLDSTTESSLCFLDAVNGMPATEATFRTTANGPVVMEGWLATLDLQAPAEVNIILDGESDYQISGSTGITRDDVAQAYDAPQLGNSGFSMQLPELTVAPGSYSLLLAHEQDGSVVVCNPALTLQVD